MVVVNTASSMGGCDSDCTELGSPRLLPIVGGCCDRKS